MNRKRFYDGVRSSLFGGRLTGEQVEGMEALLDAADDYPVTDPRQLAYILAGVFHEVGKRMVPVREGFAATDAGARAAVQRLHEQGRISRNYAAPVNGVSYYGRGRIQNTHHANYEKLEERFGHPFVANPDLLLESEIDAAVTVAGHMEGIWTGRKLADYIAGNKCDYVNARRIVNGTDRASLIAGYAKKFESALRASGFGSAPREAPVTAPPAGLPINEKPAKTELPEPVLLPRERDPAYPAPAGHNGGPPLDREPPVGGPRAKANGAGLGVLIAAPALGLMARFGWIPESVATDPQSVIELTALLLAGAAYAGAWFAPRNAIKEG